MKNMQQRLNWLLAATLGLALGLGALPTSQASAQEIQITGPLAGQPAVRHMRVYREGRIMLMPTVGYTLQDEFARSIMIGAAVNYHFLDWLGIGIWGAYTGAAVIDTDLTTQVTRNAQTIDRNRVSLPSPGNFSQQVARMQGLITAHLVFIPLRGKLSLFQGVFVDTDFYILGGAGAAFVQERADVTTGICDSTSGEFNSIACLDSQTARKDRVAIVPMFGVGLSLYINSWIGIALEWRGLPFDWNPAGTDESGLTRNGTAGDGGFPDGRIDDQDQRFYFHHMINFGIIINLPPDQPISD